MKQLAAILSMALITAACSSGVKKDSSADTTKVQPTPTPVRMVEDRSKVWRNSTDLPVALLPADLWLKLSNPEAWKEFSAQMSEAAMIGASLREGSQFSWVYDGTAVQSEVTLYEREKKLIFKGTPFASAAEIEFSVRQANATHSFLHFECRLLPGWKKSQKKKQTDFFREFSKALQGLK